MAALTEKERQHINRVAAEKSAPRPTVKQEVKAAEKQLAENTLPGDARRFKADAAVEKKNAAEAKKRK